MSVRAPPKGFSPKYNDLRIEELNAAIEEIEDGIVNEYFKSKEYTGNQLLNAFMNLISRLIAQEVTAKNYDTVANAFLALNSYVEGMIDQTQDDGVIPDIRARMHRLATSSSSLHQQQQK